MEITNCTLMTLPHAVSPKLNRTETVAPKSQCKTNIENLQPLQPYYPYTAEWNTALGV